MKNLRDVEVRAYDKNTGEIVEGVPVLCGVKREEALKLDKDT